jgi:hypothetical protein
MQSAQKLSITLPPAAPQPHEAADHGGGTS